MSETHTTTTTTTTTVERREIAVGINIGFLKTPVGMLMLAEIILGLIAWACLVSVTGFYGIPALGFAAFGFIFSWLLTLFLFIIFVFGLYGSLCANAPWGFIQVGANILFVLLFFISSCCVAAFAYLRRTWGASAAFGFIVTVLYIASFLFTFRKAYGRFPWQTATGAPAHT